MNNKQIVFIPFLILLYFFVHFSNDLFYFLDPLRSFLQFIKYFIITGILFLAGYKIFRNKNRFTLIFSSILFIFLFFGSIMDTAESYNLINHVVGVDLKIFLSFLTICLILMFIFSRTNQNIIKKLLQFWLFYILLVLVYDTGVFIFSTKKEKQYLTTKNKLYNIITTEKPSVFFLLFDMYPSDTILKRYMGNDNTDLNSFLKEKGFFVTGNAHSLYQETYYSLSSTFSLKPLEYINDNTIKEYKKKLIALKNIEQTCLLGSFEYSGYFLRNYSVFNLQGQPSPLQFNLNYHLENILTSTTFFNRFYDNFEPDFYFANRNINLGFIKNSWSTNVKTDLSSLRTDFYQLMDSTTNSIIPTFNYFHFMMPHPPVIYDSSGHENSIKDMYNYNGFNKTITNFTGYTKYANKELVKMVNEIFDKAGNNVIIIIQGDHGYRGYPDIYPDEVRYGILNAVYLPNKNYNNFNDSMTAIFTFKQVLKNQFGIQNDLQLP